ncbi:DUF4214 domain-containing protein [Pseudomonas sp. RC10]|uniref:DUF4214 domain-containing protein n=1 Tax=Pseudomonas bambusae TaxID=3139142 RepID=UPI003139EB3B
MATTIATQVQQLYVGLLGRAADQGGLNWWVDQVTTGGKTIEDIRASFVTSTEYTTTYGAAATRADLVTSIYQNLFERTPSADEVKYWAQTDTRPADQLVAAFLEFASANDQKVIDNKVFVANTYTSTVGDTNFDKAGAAAAIADVDGTSASVSTAIDNINSGSLAGQVPALGLINALTTAQAAEAAAKVGNTTAVDALVAKFVAANGVNSKALASDASYADKIVAIGKDAKAADDLSPTDTKLLATQAEIAGDAVTSARAALASDAIRADASAYEAALTAAAKVDAAKPADVAAAKAGLAADAGFTADVVTALKAIAPALSTLDATDATTKAASAETLYSFYTDADTTPALRTKVDDALKALGFATTFKTTATVDVVNNTADKLVTTTKAKIDAEDGNDAGVDPTKEFSALLQTKVNADKALADAKAADADVAAVKVITDANKVFEDATQKASDAIGNFNTGNTVSQAKVVANVDASATLKETFYFATDAAVKAGTDFKIGTDGTAATYFGAGDSIVLGSGYTFNKGALTTGDNNKLEVFLVNSNSGVQVVIESKAFGSGSATEDATTHVIAPTADNTVITLTGVTAEHLAVNNGVISYVA